MRYFTIKYLIRIKIKKFTFDYVYITYLVRTTCIFISKIYINIQYIMLVRNVYNFRLCAILAFIRIQTIEDVL